MPAGIECASLAAVASPADAQVGVHSVGAVGRCAAGGALGGRIDGEDTAAGWAHECGRAQQKVTDATPRLDRGQLPSPEDFRFERRALMRNAGVSEAIPTRRSQFMRFIRGGQTRLAKDENGTLWLIKEVEEEHRVDVVCPRERPAVTPAPGETGLRALCAARTPKASQTHGTPSRCWQTAAASPPALDRGAPSPCD